MADDNDEEGSAKAQDERLREAAKARGFRLVKSRRRKPGGDRGKYGLTDLRTKQECYGFGDDGLTATADDIRAYLRGGEAASWKRSLIGVVGKGAGDAPAKPEAGEAATPTTAKPAGRERRREAPAGRSKRGSGSKTAPPESRKVGQDASRPSTSPGTSGAVRVVRSAEGTTTPRTSEGVHSTSLTIRAAKSGDAKAIAALLGTRKAALGKALAAAIRAKRPPILAEQVGLKGVLAWTVIDRFGEPPIARITLIHVAPDARRRGIGTKLVGEARRRIAKVKAGDTEILLDLDPGAPAGFLRALGWKRSANAYRAPA